MHTLKKCCLVSLNCYYFFLVLSLLASGSDDQHAIIWDPFRHKKLTTMHTGHAANIFSVKVRRTHSTVYWMVPELRNILILQSLHN